MGYGFDENGVYVGWSNLFNTTSLETLEASENLPMPNNITYINDNNAKVDLSAYNDIVKIVDPVLRILEITKMLNFLNKSYSKEIEDINENPKKSKELTVKANKELLALINSHEHTKIPKNQKATALKNFISSHILNTIQDIRNAIGAYTPIDMEILRNAAINQSSKGEESMKMTLVNPLTVYLMLLQNMTGKTVIGIAANGEKGSFMWHYYLNDCLSKNKELDLDYIRFDFKSNRIVGRSKINKIDLESGTIKPDEVTINTLPDINTNINKELALKLGIHLNPKLKVDLMISLLLSAATDNAKELILAQINAGSKLAKVYLFLITMGFDIDDIVSFMTSSTINLYDKLTDSNIYKGYTISENDALQIIQGNLPRHFLASITDEYTNKFIKNYNILNFLKNDDVQLTNEYDLGTNGYFATEEFFNILRSIKAMYLAANVNSEDALEFKTILENANEFTNFTRMLSFNLGFGTSKLDLLSDLDLIKTCITSRENALGISSYGTVNETKAKEYLGDDYATKYSDIFNGAFDSVRWLKDEAYKKKTEEYYNKIKGTVNIFHIVDSIPLYKSLFKLLDFINEVDTLAPTVKTSLFNDIRGQYVKANYFIDDRIEKGILKFIDSLMIKDFITTFRTDNGELINIPIPKDIQLLNDYGLLNKTITSNVLDLADDTSIANFKYYFENVLISKLKKGEYYDTEGYKKDSDLESNRFIKDLLRGHDGDIPLYKCNIDMLARNKSLEATVKFTNYIKGLEALLKITIGNMKLSDLFVLYNLIVNKNNYGSDRMTTLFESFINQYSLLSLLSKYFKHIGDLDYELKPKEVLERFLSLYSFTDILIANARIVRSERGLLVPMIKIIDPEKGPIYKMKRKYGYTTIDSPYPKVPGGETILLTIDRITRYTEYFVLNNSFINQINLDLAILSNIEGDTKQLLDTIRSLIINGTLTLNKVCQ